MEIFETGDVMFQKLRSNLREANTKDMATCVGLMCFPAGLEGPEPLVSSLHQQKSIRFAQRLRALH